MQITDKQIQFAESLLIGNHHFDEERISFIKKLDSCDLLAVPGSGKTTALQAKLYCIIKSRKRMSHQGILTLSHTNAAVEEIKKSLKTSCPELFEYPNFVGTVQDFVDTFLAIPYYNKTFGHNISRIDSNIHNELFLKIFNQLFRSKNKALYYYLNHGARQALKFNLRLSSEGIFVPWNYEEQKPFVAMSKMPSTWYGHETENIQLIHVKLENIKNILLSHGILNYDDCYVLAQKYISETPRIISIIGTRFPYVFVDETQDLQSHQLEIIDSLFNREGICLQRIGDINQTIFNSGTQNAECSWMPRNVITFNNSMRLTSEVASVVDSFMLKRFYGFSVNGMRILDNPIKPYLLVYDYDNRKKIKSRFKELIELHNLNDTVEGVKYGFHIIGWNGKWSDDKVHIPNQLRLCNILEEYENANKEKVHDCQNLADYISSSLMMTHSGQITKIIYSIACECLRLGNIYNIIVRNGEQKQLPYTVTSLQDYIKAKGDPFVAAFNQRVFNVVKQTSLHNIEGLELAYKDFLNLLFDEFKVTTTDRLNDFLSDPLILQDKQEDKDEIEIKYETVHNAKGKTHCATLYVDTMYQGKYESAHVLRVLKKGSSKRQTTYYPNPFYKEIGEEPSNTHVKSAIKMAYVGLSRPTHLLCYAMHKSSYERYDAEKLQICGWEIIDLTTS